MAKTITVLGISLSTRAAGLVVLSNTTLLDWQIKTFKESWSPHKTTLIIQAIERTIKEHHVTCIAIKTQPSYATNREINLIIKKLKERCKKLSIVVYEYSSKTLKQSQPIPIRSKQELMRYMVVQYPYLQSLYQKEINNRNPYHIKIFEALLAAHHCLQTLVRDSFE